MLLIRPSRFSKHQPGDLNIPAHVAGYHTTVDVESLLRQAFIFLYFEKCHVRTMM